MKTDNREVKPVRAWAFIHRGEIVGISREVDYMSIDNELPNNIIHVDVTPVSQQESKPVEEKTDYKKENASLKLDLEQVRYERGLYRDRVLEVQKESNEWAKLSAQFKNELDNQDEKIQSFKSQLTAQSEALRVAEEAFQKIVTWGKQHDEMNNMYATALNTLSAITQLRKGDEV